MVYFTIEIGKFAEDMVQCAMLSTFFIYFDQYYSSTEEVQLYIEVIVFNLT